MSEKEDATAPLMFSDTDAENQRYLKNRKTAQLLSFGGWFAIIGLLFSLVMMVFRRDCDVDFHMGVKMSYHGEIDMCRNSKVGQVDIVKTGDEDIAKGMVINVPSSPCLTNDDCSDVKGGFCQGGPGLLMVDGYCQESSNSCTCKQLIDDCGLNRVLEWSFQLKKYIKDCAPRACNETLSARTPLWMIQKGQLGCDSRRTANVFDAMLAVQYVAENYLVNHPVKPESDPVWNDLRATLALNPQVEFDSFWPSTISESVSEGFSPEARIFIGFMLCAGLCLFSSDYVDVCPTVDLPTREIPFIHVRLNMMRTYLPPLGLILLALVQMVPTSMIFGLNEAMMTVVHLAGAQFVFVVYLVCETVSLLDESNRKEMTSSEYSMRLILVVIGVTAMVTFVVVYGLLMLFSGGEDTPYVSDPFSGMSDMYIRERSRGAAYLVRPAEGQWKALKKVSYFAEYTVAMSILVSHLVIAHYFSKAVRMADYEAKVMSRELGLA